MMLPTCAPHEIPDLSPIKDELVFHEEGIPVLARWTTDFDCGYETDFWYTIKDTPFELSKLKAKRRYEIKRGIRNFDVHLINPADYAEPLADVIAEAFSAYPESYRPRLDKERLISETASSRCTNHVYGAFCRESGELCGFARIKEEQSFAEILMLKARPRSEKLQVNAATIYAILNDFDARLKSGYYISNGTRNVSHETNFNEYLGKYFGFRRAYCHLHIVYRWPMNWIVNILYPFRDYIRGNGRLMHKVKAVLRMEEIQRKCKRENE